MPSRLLRNSRVGFFSFPALQQFMLIPITDFELDDDRLADGNYYVQFVCGSQFTDADGVEHLAQSVQEFAASATSGRLTAPDIEVVSTTDALVNQRSSYTVKVTKTNASRTEVFNVAQGIVVPPTLAPGYAWAELKLFAGARHPVQDNQTYSKLETLREIDLKFAQFTVPPDASAAVKGLTRLSKIPVGAPIAVGANEDAWVNLQAGSLLSTGAVALSADTGASGTHGIVFKTRDTQRSAILNNGAFDFDNAYYDLNSTDPTLQTWTQQNNAYPTFGEPNYPAHAMLYLRGDPAAGNLFGMVTEVETGSGLKAALPAGHHGGYVAAVHGTARSTLLATTTLDVYGGNFVAEVNTGWSTGIALGCEVSVNNNVADITSVFHTIQSLAGMVTGVSIGSGGKYIPGNGLEFFAAHAAAKFRRVIVIPHESLQLRAIEVGSPLTPISAALPGLIAVKGIDTGNGFTFHRGSALHTGNAFAAYNEGTTLTAYLNVDGAWAAQWYKTMASDGFQVWKNNFTGTPDFAGAVSLNKPGDPLGNSLSLSTLAAGVWTMRLQFDHATGQATFVNSVAIGGGNAVREVRTATASLNFPSIAAGATAELTIAVTNAAAGDAVVVSPDGSPESGLSWSGFVSSAGTVTVRLANVTSGAIDPAARTWRATAIGF